MSTQTAAVLAENARWPDDQRIRVHHLQGPLSRLVGLPTEVVFRRAHPSSLGAYLRVVDAGRNEADTITGARILDAELQNDADNNQGTRDHVV